MINILYTFFLIEMVQDNDFILFVPVMEKLWDCFILFYSGTWEIQCFSNMVLLILVGVPKI